MRKIAEILVISLCYWAAIFFLHNKNYMEASITAISATLWLLCFVWENMKNVE